jgi:hypothetical protein
MAAERSNEDPAAIEQDVARTQDQMGETVQKLEDKLNPREFTRSVLGDEAMDWTEEAFRLAKENPLPVAMIVGGAVWLVATSRSPLIRRAVDRLTERFSGNGGSEQALRSRSPEPTPIGPPPAYGEEFDRRPA